jgi:hypothetical protein
VIRAAAVAVLLMVAGCGSIPSSPQGAFSTIPPPTTPAPSSTSTPPIDPARAVTWPLPDRTLTPGSVTPGCTYPRPAGQRDVTAATRRAVLAEYKYTGPTSAVEIDHLIPFSLCGANAVSNLWVEPNADLATPGPYSLNHKDLSEAAIASKVRYHKVDGGGEWTLARAQALFKDTDWRVIYCTYVTHPAVDCTGL